MFDISWPTAASADSPSRRPTPRNLAILKTRKRCALILWNSHHFERATTMRNKSAEISGRKVKFGTICHVRKHGTFYTKNVVTLPVLDMFKTSQARCMPLTMSCVLGYRKFLSGAAELSRSKFEPFADCSGRVAYEMWGRFDATDQTHIAISVSISISISSAISSRYAFADCAVLAVCTESHTTISGHIKEGREYHFERAEVPLWYTAFASAKPLAATRFSTHLCGSCFACQPRAPCVQGYLISVKVGRFPDHALDPTSSADHLIDCDLQRR